MVFKPVRRPRRRKMINAANIRNAFTTSAETATTECFQPPKQTNARSLHVTRRVNHTLGRPAILFTRSLCLQLCFQQSLFPLRDQTPQLITEASKKHVAAIGKEWQSRPFFLLFFLVFSSPLSSSSSSVLFLFLFSFFFLFLDCV